MRWQPTSTYSICSTRRPLLAKMSKQEKIRTKSNALELIMYLTLSIVYCRKDNIPRLEAPIEEGALWNLILLSWYIIFQFCYYICLKIPLIKKHRKIAISKSMAQCVQKSRIFIFPLFWHIYITGKEIKNFIIWW